VTLTVEVPNVDALKRTDGLSFIGVVSQTLARYDMRAPAFNFAAKSKIITPLDKKTMFFYPEEAQGVIFAGIQAIREYEATGNVSQTTREKFILEETKDIIRNVNTNHETPEFKAFTEKTLADVSAKMTGIGSLAFAPAVLSGNAYTVKSAKIGFGGLKA